MSPTQQVLLVIVIVGGALLFGIALFSVLRKTFRRHDPARALASVQLSGVGDFRLELPKGKGGTVWFRFEIDGNTDDDYDLFVRGTLGSRAFAWRTQEKSRIDGAGDSQMVTSTYAVTGTTGSFELGSFGTEGGLVSGKVEEGTPNLLVRGWVYVPPVE